MEIGKHYRLEVFLFVFAFLRASCETFMRTLAIPLLIIF